MTRQWCLVTACYDASTQRVNLHQQPLPNRYNNHLSKFVPVDMNSYVTETVRIKPADAEREFLWDGAYDHNTMRGDFVTQCYNDKIDRADIIAATLSGEQMSTLLNPTAQ